MSATNAARPSPQAEERRTRALGGRFDLFELLPEPVAQAFLDASRPRSVPDGHVIYQQGDIGTEVYRIVSGQVRLSVLHSDGRELVFVTFEPGDAFGISTLIDNEPLPHTAEAHGPVQLQVVSRAAFAALRAEHRAIDEAMLRLLCRHMRALSTYVTEATLNDLTLRLARRLLEVARPGADRLPAIRLPQAELAQHFGVSRQTINKLLKQFEDEGLVRLAYGSVVLLDLAGLRSYAEL